MQQTTLENFQLKFSIDTWEKESDNKTNKDIIHYQIYIESEMTNKKWYVMRTIDNFKKLMSKLFKICLNLPPIPPLNIKDSGDAITSIGKDIEDYLHYIISRGDVLNTQAMIDFLSIGQHFNNITQFLPQTALQISDFKLQISDFIFAEKENLLFVSCAKKSNKNFIEKYSFVNKLSTMFQKSNYGEIILFKMNLTSNEYIKLFSLETKGEISSLTIIDNMLFVGYFDSLIDVYQVDYVNSQNSVISSSLFKHLFSIKINDKNLKIISIGFNKLSNFIYTVCEGENEIKIAKMYNKEKIISLPISFDELCGFIYDSYSLKTINRFIAYDIKGKLFVGVISNDNQKAILEYVINCNVINASLFKVDFIDGYIYIGNPDGQLCLFHFNKINEKYEFYKSEVNLKKRERNFTEVVTMDNPYYIKDAVFNWKKNILYIAMENGTIQILSHSKDYAECVINVDNKRINRIMLSKDNAFLLCGGEDSKISIYSLPKYLISEMTRKKQETNLKQAIQFDRNVRNEINYGHPKTIDLNNKSSFLETYLLKDPNEQENNEVWDQYSFLYMKI